MYRGATRSPPSPSIPESLSYLSLAHLLSLLPANPIPANSGKNSLPLNLRAATEEYALDSYENFLFSFARFHEVTGRWPDKVTVVGYGMKRRRCVAQAVTPHLLMTVRFEQLHRAAIGFPAERFTYIGIDDEGDTTEHYAGEVSRPRGGGRCLCLPAEIRLHALPHCSIRMSSTVINQTSSPKPIFPLSPLSHLIPGTHRSARMVSAIRLCIGAKGERR